MLTGGKPFPGDDVTQTLARVVEREPAWDALPSKLSPVLATYLRRCLAKEPKQRIPDVAAIRLALEGAFEIQPAAQTEALGSQPTRWQRTLPFVAGVAAAVVTGLVVWTVMRPPSVVVTRFTALPPPGVEASVFFRLSPDGRMLAYEGLSEGVSRLSPDGRNLVNEGASRLYLRSLDELEAVPLRGGGERVAGGLLAGWSRATRSRRNSRRECVTDAGSFDGWPRDADHRWRSRHRLG